MPGLVTKAAYARHRGVTRQAVDYALKTQRITAEPDGRIDVAKADAAWEANTHPIHGGVRTMHGRAPRAKSRTPRTQPPQPRPKSTPEPVAPPQAEAANRASEAPPQEAADASARTGLIDAKTQREEWNAKLAEMDYRKRSGELVEVDQVRRVLTEGALAVRDALFGIPSRVAGVLAPEQTPAEVKAVLDDEITKALDGLVQAMEKLGAA